MKQSIALLILGYASAAFAMVLAALAAAMQWAPPIPAYLAFLFVGLVGVSALFDPGGEFTKRGVGA
ncbi:MAG TPA: hypothetical protein VKJ47_00190 [Candidatus Binatia bacterium]|nr:hypothetical protein [Candidatus Binatia bacterium]